MDKRAQKRFMRKYRAKKSDRIVGEVMIKGKPVPLTGDTAEILDAQVKAFRDKFGRDPVGDDPLFFDCDSDTPQLLSDVKLMREIELAMREAGIDERMIYASTKTGLFPTESNYKLLSDRDRADWEAALKEFDDVGATSA